MSINIGDNLSYLGAKPLDGRLKYDTVSEMAGMSDNVLYDGCLAYCVGSDKTYQWKSSNAVDPTTGKWREFTSGGGTAEDPIEYVSELPTSGIEDKIYGIRVTSGITKTIQIIKPIPGQLSKEEATAYFSQFFTVTEESSTRLSLSVYPDLVLSRDGWSDDYKAADGDIVTLTYLVDTQELSWTNSSSQETSTAAWSVSPISCTSAYFPTYKYYAGVESSQELNEIGAGGGSVDDVIEDVITLPTSDVQDIFYRTEEITDYTTSYPDFSQTEESLMALFTPYGFTKGERISNYHTTSDYTYYLVIKLANPKNVYIKTYESNYSPGYLYIFQGVQGGIWKVGERDSQSGDGFYNATNTIAFGLGEGKKLFAGDSSNNTTSPVGSAEADEWTILKDQQGVISVNEEINPSEFTGTMAEWEALPTATKALYQRLNTTDDDGGAVLAPIYKNISNSPNNEGQDIYTNVTNSMEMALIILRAVKSNADTTRNLTPFVGHMTAYTTDGTDYPNVGVATYIASACWGASGNAYVRMRIMADSGNEYEANIDQLGSTYSIRQIGDATSTTGNVIINSSYGSGTNVWYRKGNVVNLYINNCNMNANVPNLTKISNNTLPKPVGLVRFIALQLNSLKCRELQITTNGELTTGQTNSDTFEAGYWVGNITYITEDS